MNLMETVKITSTQNPTIKQFSGFNRRKTPDLILLDGSHLNQEYVKATQQEPTQTLISERFKATGEFNQFKHWKNLIEIPDSLMLKLSPTKSPAGILSLAPKPKVLTPNSDQLVVILENIQDPGNLGTMLRTSLSMGVSQVLLLGECVDLWNPKSLRAGMGAQFYLASQEISDLQTWSQDFQAPIMATSLQGENLWQQPLPQKLALVFGNEGQGVSAATQTRCDHLVKIPMQPNAESLNVASSLAILTHEWARQNNVF